VPRPRRVKVENPPDVPAPAPRTSARTSAAAKVLEARKIADRQRRWKRAVQPDPTAPILSPRGTNPVYAGQ